MHKIAIGCDPNAADAKNAIITILTAKGYAIHDFCSDDPIYANVAFEVATSVSSKNYDRGILICGTGIGM